MERKGEFIIAFIAFLFPSSFFYIFSNLSHNALSIVLSFLSFFFSI